MKYPLTNVSSIENRIRLLNENDHSLKNGTIRRIRFKGVNCYLVKVDSGFILIDTSFWIKRKDLEEELKKVNCVPGTLKLLILTHGDSDHVGNCVFLRRKYDVEIAMHYEDLGMVEHGDITWNRKYKPDKNLVLFRIIEFFGKTSKIDTFKPDLFLKEGDELSEYGFNAKVIYIPGHSKGSIGILTSDGNFFCGDLLINFLKPRLHFLIDNLAEANASIQMLKKMGIKKVYPGHGKPFTLTEFIQKNQPSRLSQQYLKSKKVTLFIIRKANRAIIAAFWNSIFKIKTFFFQLWFLEFYLYYKFSMFVINEFEKRKTNK